MGRGDSRLTRKMRRRRAQNNLKSRIVRQAAVAHTARMAAKPAAPAAAAPAPKTREKK